MSKPIPPRVFLVLTAVVLVAVIAVAVVLSAGAVLGAMGDSPGAAAVRTVGLGCGAVLAIAALCLILGLGVNAASEARNLPREDEE
jgi:hypothetical protein